MFDGVREVEKKGNDEYKSVAEKRIQNDVKSMFSKKINFLGNVHFAKFL